MKKKFILLLFLNAYSGFAKKTVIIPLSDAYPSRYNYHSEFFIDRFDVENKWICRGVGSVRFQHSFHGKHIASILFDNPLVVTAQGQNNTYCGQVLGLGFQECNSKSNFTATIINDYINCKVEISKINSPFYVQLGIPIQRSAHTLTMTENSMSDQKVIKGGFAQEYQPATVPDFSLWKETPSTIIRAIENMKKYLKGNIIGNMEARYHGLLTEETMVIWSLADIYLQLGHEGIHTKHGHFGGYIKGVIPTSPTLKEKWNRFIFFPVIGNVNRGECGIGVNGNYLFFDTDSSNLKLYIDGYGGYLFAAEHLRPYDFNNGFFSRYGGVKVFNSDMTYKNRLLWGVDLTTHTQSIGNALKSELVFDLIYQKFQSFFNLCYSFKSQSKEQIKNCKKINIRTNNIYGYSPQSFVQTPNPKTQNNWTSILITPNSSMQKINPDDISLYQSNFLSGIPANTSSTITNNDIDYNSALMDAQILNIFSLGYSYQLIKETMISNFAFKGAIGISPIQYYTPEFFEFLISIELLY